MTHDEHAKESYDFKQEADEAKKRGNHDLATDRMQWAQWHATMALYELTFWKAGSPS
jgi:hypothetical protein